MKKIIVSLAIALVFSSAGCKPWLEKLRDTTIECTKEIGASAGLDLGIKVLAALREKDWKPALQELVNTFGKEVICIVGNLPELYAKRPTVSPAELAKHKTDMQRAAEFLKLYNITVKRPVKKAAPPKAAAPVKKDAAAKDAAPKADAAAAKKDGK